MNDVIARNPTGRIGVAGLVFLLAAVACASPSGSHPASQPALCQGRVEVRSESDLARISSCRAIRGDLRLDGGGLEHARPLAELHRVTGSVQLGPTLALPAIDLLIAVEIVDGNLSIDTNLSAGGVYLPALRRVAGDLVITGNTALAGINAPLVSTIGGDLFIAGNPSLERIDLGGLREIAGSLEIARNTALDDLVMPALAAVGGALRIADNPALPPAVATELAIQVGHEP